MRITCDSDCCMGYIYLQPPRSLDYPKDMTTISKYIPLEEIAIPILNGNLVNGNLGDLKVSPRTYTEAIKADEFEEEFRNDKDADGYLCGVELSLTKDEFIQLVSGKHYRIYRSTFEGNGFDLVTFDTLDKVLDNQNIIYPLTASRDVFVVIEITCGVGLIKGLLSARQDIYSLDYLSNPEFILSE